MRENAKPAVKRHAMLAVHEVGVEHLGTQADPISECPLRAEAGDPAPARFFDFRDLIAVDPRRVDSGGGDRRSRKGSRLSSATPARARP
jgi:hypothetical protein